jgi:hypothetical protein
MTPGTKKRGTWPRLHSRVALLLFAVGLDSLDRLVGEVAEYPVHIGLVEEDVEQVGEVFRIGRDLPSS